MTRNNWRTKQKNIYLILILFLNLGAHQVAKLQNMVETTRQRLNDLKFSQKNVDQSYNLLQVIK